jgi:hypothetical protein
MIERSAAGAGLEFKAHPHMLRHACGCALANKGHDTRAIQGWLGHRSITSAEVSRPTGWALGGGCIALTAPGGNAPGEPHHQKILELSADQFVK